MLPKEQKQAYESFYDSARQNQILDKKITLLLHLASAMSLDCEP